MEINDQTLKLLTVFAYTLIILYYGFLAERNYFLRLLEVIHQIRQRWEENGHLKITYSLYYEILPVVLVSTGINVIGWGITSKVEATQNVLYLDMVGTALSGFLLGPWWGAFVGILSQSINASLYPHNQEIAPYMLVNITAGIFWGAIGRTSKFGEYLDSKEQNPFKQFVLHIRYILILGIVGAAVTAIVGALVASVNPDKSADWMSLGLPPNSDFGKQVNEWFTNGKSLITTLTSHREPISSILTECLRWAIITFRYIPNTAFSAAIGLVAVKYCFPNLEQHLICDRDKNHLRGDSWLTPVICLIIYFLPNSPFYKPFIDIYSILWYFPAILFFCAALYSYMYGASSRTLLDERLRRIQAYQNALKEVGEKPFLTGAIIIVVVLLSLFTLGLFLVGQEQSRGTFALYISLTVTGYLIVFLFLRYVRSQWAAALQTKGTLLSTAQCEALQAGEDKSPLSPDDSGEPR